MYEVAQSSDSRGEKEPVSGPRLFLVGPEPVEVFFSFFYFLRAGFFLGLVFSDLQHHQPHLDPGPRGVCWPWVAVGSCLGLLSFGWF